MSIFVPSALAQPITLSLFNGKPAMSRFIHQSVSTTVQFSDKSTQELDLLVTKLHPLAPIVLGLPWLWKTNPVVDWANLSLTFRTGPKSALPPMMVAMSCVTTAPRHKDITLHISPPFASIPELQSEGTLNPTDLSRPVIPSNTVNLGTVISADSSNVADKNIFISADSSNVASTPCSVDSGKAANKNIPGNPATLNNVLGGFCKDPPRSPMISGYVLNRTPGEFHSVVPTPSALGSLPPNMSSPISDSPPVQISQYSAYTFPMDPYDPLPFPEEMDAMPFTRRAPPPISIIGATAFKKLIDQGYNVFTLNVRPGAPPTKQTHLRAVSNDLAPPTMLHAKPLPTDKGALIAKVVPPEYHNFFDVFSWEEAKFMPPHQPYDHTIDLKDDQMPPHSHIYPLSGTELIALCEFLDDMLSKGFIQGSDSPGGAPVLFAKKKDTTLHLCVDFQKLNRITRKNHYPIPLVTNLIDQLGSAKIYTKFDLRAGYYNVQIAAGHEWKTVFQTRYGSFKFLVMLMGLTNAPATFQHFMKDIFQDMSDIFVIVYLDDILVYSESVEEH